MGSKGILRYGVILLVLCALAAAGWFGWKQYAASKAPPAWRTAKVERGPITASVSATGTLNPVRSVQIGSQVSGQLKEVYVDFNDVVKEGQLVARIDPESFDLRVRQAQADVEAARATVGTQLAGVGAQRAAVSREEVNVVEAKRDLERKQMLFDKGFISAADRDRALALVNTSQEQLKTTLAQLAVAEAQTKNAEAIVKQRDAQLAQARVDLERTAIRAPVDGVIIRRSVDAGQTVAASLQAPELFILARNLTDMQVEASIDEAEVGRLAIGQRATFTVDSFPGRIFSGEVLQVRKSARVVQNVVTYIAIISAINPDLSLLPGMTANIRVVTEQRPNVLKVPNAALRFRPQGYVDPAPGAAAPVASVAPSSVERDDAAPDAAKSAKSGAAAKSAPGKGERAVESGDAPKAGGNGNAGGAQAQQAFRQRLQDELKLDAEQTAKLDKIFAAQRPRAVALRELPEEERARAAAKNRTELRAEIAAILKPEQKGRYDQIIAEIAAQARARAGEGVAAAQGGGQKGAPRQDRAAADKGDKGGAAGPGSPQAAAAAQFRQRLVNELKLDDEQQKKLEQIYAAQRGQGAALRGMAPAERGKAAERVRAELRLQIFEILKPEQRTRYGEIIAETAGRQAASGRVFILDEQGQPRAVAVRLGLSDGASTEVVGGNLKEGDTVLIGTAGAAAPARGGGGAGGASKGPAMPVSP
jgi:HlyD family secretion protein